MSTGVYCMSPDERRANAILTALRGAGFANVSLLMLKGGLALHRAT